MILWNRILVGFDDRPRSMNAVRYLASVLGGSNTCKVCLLAVYVPPSPDMHPDPQGLENHDSDRRVSLELALSEAHRLLIEARLVAENVTTELIEITPGKTVGQTIMDYRRAGGYGTVVVGRRNMSKAEEFLFGSVSNTVVHQATDCCVWVVA
jgi:nucleotide-binding universal stress UspA family protein